MAVEFTVELADRPGALAEMGFVLEEAGVNIEAVHGLVIGEDDPEGRLPDIFEDTETPSN